MSFAISPCRGPHVMFQFVVKAVLFSHVNKCRAHHKRHTATNMALVVPFHFTGTTSRVLVASVRFVFVQAYSVLYLLLICLLFMNVRHFGSSFNFSTRLNLETHNFRPTRPHRSSHKVQRNCTLRNQRTTSNLKLQTKI